MQNFLGCMVEDYKVSNIRGVAIMRVTWMNGCVAYHVQPRKEKGKELEDAKSIDEDNLKLYGKSPIKCEFLAGEAIHKPRYKLGAKAEDKVSGLKGTIVGEAIEVSGRVRYGIEPKAPDNNGKATTYWFDAARVKCKETAIWDASDLRLTDADEKSANKTYPGGPATHTAPPSV